jgi:hypothetical protein
MAWDRAEKAASMEALGLPLVRKWELLLGLRRAKLEVEHDVGPELGCSQ